MIKSINVYLECGHREEIEWGAIPDVGDEDYVCSRCNEEKKVLDVITGPPPSIWVNVYFIERKYGGPEEGGWYYNWYTCVESVECKNEEEVEEMVSKLKDKYEDENFGNIYSVLGGQKVKVLEESYVAESHSMYRPQYE